MQKARGFSGLQIIGILVAAAALVGAIAGAIHLITSHLDGVRTEAKAAGIAECDAAYKARDNEQLIKLQTELLAALKAKEAAEKEAARLSKVLGERVKKEKADADATAARTLADLQSGALVLRDGVVQTVACPADDGGEAAAKASGARPSSVGKTCYRLAREAEEEIVAAGARADKYAAQINGLLEQRARDVAMCNGDPTAAPAP